MVFLLNGRCKGEQVGRRAEGGLDLSEEVVVVAGDKSDGGVLKARGQLWPVNRRAERKGLRSEQDVVEQEGRRERLSISGLHGPG